VLLERAGHEAKTALVSSEEVVPIPRKGDLGIGTVVQTLFPGDWDGFASKGRDPLAERASGGIPITSRLLQIKPTKQMVNADGRARAQAA